MIEEFRGRNLQFLFDVISAYKDEDFYLTSENKRLDVDSISKLKQLIKQCTHIFIRNNEDDELLGVVMIWKSFGGEISRHYVKLVAKNSQIASDLLTQVNWSIPNILYVKIGKHSKFLRTFQLKGYKFFGGRGSQLLLKRDKTAIPSKFKEKDDDDSDQYRTSRKVSNRRLLNSGN